MQSLVQDRRECADQRARVRSADLQTIAPRRLRPLTSTTRSVTEAGFVNVITVGTVAEAGRQLGCDAAGLARSNT